MKKKKCVRENQKKHHTRLTPDWFYAHESVKAEAFKRGPTNKANQLVSFLWPSATEYHSPLNPIFLVECMNVEILRSRSVWLVRDGLIPLLWFFKVNPTPGLFRGRLLVDEEFVPFIPTPWREQTGSYSIQNIKSPSQIEPDKILITGLINERCCSLEFLEKTLDKAASILGSAKLERIEKSCFLLPKSSPFGGEYRHNFFFECILKVAEKIGLNNIKPVSWQTLENTSTFENSYLLDLNEKTIFADNFIAHSVLRRGGRLLLSKNFQKEKGNFVQLSPYHGVSFVERVPGKYMLDLHNKSLSGTRAYFLQFEALMRSEANLSIPWPSWFVDWKDGLPVTQNSSLDN